MILRALTLENFKGIGAPVRLEFAPLTLLFGPNNAGKSTIVQALMYAREVLERNECDVGQTMLGGDVLDLGGFRSLVHGQDTDQAIRMRFELGVGDEGLPEFWNLYERAHALQDRFDMVYSGDPLTEFYDQVWLNTPILYESHAALRDFWLDLEIGYQMSSRNPMRHKPVVRRYAVGVGSTAYAVITLPDDSDRAEIKFDYGVPPFGCTYQKGPMDDSEWDMARLARRAVLKRLRAEGWAERGLGRGAKVAFADETLTKDSNMMSRKDFDDLIGEIVAGGGIWDDASTDAKTGKPSREYELRQSLIEEARRLAERREKLLKAERDYQLLPKESQDPLSDEALELALYRRESRLPDSYSGLGSGEVDATSETASRVSRWVDRIAAHHECFDLTLSGSARPDWNELLRPFSDIWIEHEAVGTDDEVVAYAKDEILSFWSTIVIQPGRMLLETLKASTYLGPFRRLPSRAYKTEARPEPQSWASGLGAWDLLSGGSQKVLRDHVNAWLRSEGRFGTKYEVIAQRRKKLDVNGDLWNALVGGQIQAGTDEIGAKLESLPEESKLELRNVDSGLALAPQDLGVGISQVIPVIVAALHEEEGQKARIVMIEEPEANTHPAFQVVLADLFLSQAKANPTGLFLIETHSEHLMLRCLRRIRETSEGKQGEDVPPMTPEDIAVHFIEPSNRGPVIHRIRIDSDGEFMDPWPRGFFPERAKEIYGDDL